MLLSPTSTFRAAKSLCISNYFVTIYKSQTSIFINISFLSLPEEILNPRLRLFDFISFMQNYCALALMEFMCLWVFFHSFTALILEKYVPPSCLKFEVIDGKELRIKTMFTLD
uniref:Uncharacterized protein n=1 Tax=Glossina brevipalpis TaxID=37001 RepID=A0A1A9WYW0_9MUSC